MHNGHSYTTKFASFSLFLCLLNSSLPQLYTSSLSLQVHLLFPQQSCHVYQNFPSIFPWLCAFTLISFIVNDLYNLSFHAYLVHIKSKFKSSFNETITELNPFTITLLSSSCHPSPKTHCKLFWFTDGDVMLPCSRVFSYACIVYPNEW